MRQKGGFRLKFKLLSAVLLLICFVFLGIITDAIPVRELPEDAAAGLFSVFSGGASPTPAATEARPALPPARTAPAATPVHSPSATPAATETVSPAVSPQTAPVSSGPEATPAPTAGPSPVPTEGPSPTEEDLPPEEAVRYWEPAAAVISTTITWNDPLQNETGYPVDGAALLAGEPDVSLPEEGPQILIIHTHGTEAYTPDGEDRYEASGDYRTTDAGHNILRVGRILGEALESYGLHVLVDTGLYDWPNYDGAYARSGQAIQSYLDEYPGIQVVIDLHRDALGDDETVYKTVSDQVLPEAAQIMFVVGTDKTLTHPNWRENLDFAMSLQGVLEEKYPHIMRPTLLSSNRYNQQLTPFSVLLEIGTAGNTLQEAITSAELFAEAVGPVLADRVGV